MRSHYKLCDYIGSCLIDHIVKRDHIGSCVITLEVVLSHVEVASVVVLNGWYDRLQELEED